MIRLKIFYVKPIHALHKIQLLICVYIFCFFYFKTNIYNLYEKIQYIIYMIQFTRLDGLSEGSVQ